MKTRVVGDVSRLPPYDFGARSTMWWGTMGFVAIEGMGFALAAGAYLYLAYFAQRWPLGAAPPGLIPGTALLAVLLLSVWPNMKASQNAKKQDLGRVRRDMVLMSLIGAVALAIRGFEFGMLNVRWDDNAYGSILWTILGLHTLHLATDLGDTVVLTVLMFTRHGHGRRFTDVSDNAFYWNFVVASWIPIYALIYLFPRL
jgi:heme/copper-type cytochrome/quinol oxidase subunit 3